MVVHFGLRLLHTAADHASCHYYPGINQTGNCNTYSVGQVIRTELSKICVQWMKRDCVIPAFPLGPSQSQLWVGAGQG